MGIDIGTTAVKAVRVDAEGKVLARARVPHRLITPAPDLLEHDAGQAWRRGPLKAYAEVVGAGPEPAGVCVASMVPSLAAVGRGGRPCSPGLLYGDGRGRPLAAPVAVEGRAEVSNVMPDAVGFLRWAVRDHAGAAGYWPAQAVADFALGAVPAIDTAMAISLGDLLVGGTWDQAMLEQIGVREDQLPTVVQMGAAAGTVTGSGTVLAGGTVDALCDQIVSGADHSGDVLVICGATLVVWAVIDDWIEVPGLWTVPHFAPGKVLVGGPSNAGALFVDWARSVLGRPPRPGRAQKKAPVIDPYRVPVWLPYIRGERAPYHDTSLRSGLHDLDITHGTDSIERAAYESSGFVVRNMLRRAGIEAKRIVASGGGTKVAAWMQAMADASGLPVDTVGVHEGAALGAAFMARMAAGLDTDINNAGLWATTGARFEPDSAWRAAADERFARFVALSPV